MASADIDDAVFIPVLQRVLFLWLIPYAVWFLLAHAWGKTWDWVTEPPHMA